MGLTALREKKTYTDKTILNPAARDDTLRSKHTKQSAVVNELRTVGPCDGSEVKNYINTVQFLAQTDCFVSLDLNVSSRAAGFNLVLSVYVFLTLKVVSPIDCHYMTDRLQWFELKTFICVLLKKQSHLHLGCPGGNR